MGLYVGNTAITAAYLGTVSYTALYVGANLGYQPGGGAVIPPGRIAEITTSIGNKTAVVPQDYEDYVATDAADPNTHPHFNTYTHTAIKSGNWSDPTVWNTGTVPNANAVVDIGSYTVTYDLESNVLIKDIHVGGQGTFQWVTNLDTRLWVDTIMCHGIFKMGVSGAPIGESATLGKPRAEIVFWQSEAPLATTRLGLSTMGPVRIYGATKSDRLQSLITIPVGATSATLTDLSTANWRVGDTIVIAGTEQGGVLTSDAQYTGPTSFYGPALGSMGTRTANQYRQSKDETRVITSIVGNVVSWTGGLTYDHKMYSRNLLRGQTKTSYPIVANVCRSIRFRSADASDSAVWTGDLTNLQKRAHTMFMFSADVQACYAEAKNMARTSTDPTLVAPTFATEGSVVTEAVIRATNGGTILTNANNVRGRYAWHIHGTGAYFGRKQVVFKGLTAWAPQTEVPQPGWAMTHHNARASIENCVIYNVRGAGIVSEKGNEIGQWLNNTVMWARGDGFALDWGTRHEIYENHNGHSGVGYENQSRNILQHNNIATSCNQAWTFFQQNTNKLVRITDEMSLRLYDPIAQGGSLGIDVNEFASDNNTYGIEQAQIPDFNENHAYGCGSWFFVSHRQYTDRYDSTPMLSHGCFSINNSTAFNLRNYSFYYSFYDFVWIGDTVGTAVGATLGSVSWQFMFVNGYLENMFRGFDDAGLLLNYNGDWIDNTFVNCTTAFQNLPIAINDPGDDPTLHPAYQIYGPWTITNAAVPNPGYTAIVRNWQNRLTADFPLPYPGSGGAGYGLGGVEPSPGTPKPYFYLDPGSDVSITTANTQAQLNIYGAIVDDVGVRRYPDWQTSESSLANMSVKGGRTAYYTTGEELIGKNRCWTPDGGTTWKSTLWFSDHNRMNGNYFQWYVDVNISGIASDVLTANQVADRNATKPVLPLLPEATSSSGIVADLVVPTIISVSNPTATNGQTLNHRLRASKGQGSWAIVGGVDAAKFQIANTFYLQWTGNVVKMVASPDDSNLDLTYEVQVRFTDTFGNQSAVQSMAVPLQYFQDTFDGDALTTIESRPGWTYVSGAAGALTLDGNGALNRPTASDLVVKSYNLTSYNQAAEAVYIGNTGWSHICLRMTDANNYISMRRSDSPAGLLVYARVAGVDTVIATYTQADTTGTYRLEVSGSGASTTAIVKRNGVTQTPLSGGTAVASPPADSYQVGIRGRAGGGGNIWLSSVKYQEI